MSVQDDGDHVLVLDNGGCSIQAGFAGDDAPRCFMSTCIGRPYNRTQRDDHDIRDFYVGDDAQKKRSVLNLEYPIERGIIKNWDDMETIWDHVFDKELKTSSKNHPVMITEPPLNPKAQKERTAQAMFETFGTPGFYLAPVPILAIFSAGRTTAISVHIGDGLTHVAHVYEGYCNEYATRRLDFAGKDLTRNLQKLLHERGYDFSTSSELEILRKMKEKLCYVAHDYELEKRSLVQERTFELPDGKTITIGNEMFKCPEALFRPIQGLNCDGIQHLFKSHLDATDIDCKRDLYGNVALTGASSLFTGLHERLYKELKLITPETMKLRVTAPPERKSCVWIGGSILGSLSTFDRWITKQDYEEKGPNVIHQQR